MTTNLIPKEIRLRKQVATQFEMVTVKLVMSISVVFLIDLLEQIQNTVQHQNHTIARVILNAPDW